MTATPIPMFLLYHIAIYLLGLGLQLAAPFNAKARAWVRGRRNWDKRLRANLQAVGQGRSWLWIHCASLGEFEQGRPVIEELKLKDPDLAVLLTFYSPSGYEIRKDYPKADHVAYLPLDTTANARRFLEIVRPVLVIFVKYEFWFTHLRAIQRRNIPLLLISGIFRPGQLFFRPFGRPFLKILKGFDHLFVQNGQSLQILREFGITRASLAGDTRVDRVQGLAESTGHFPLIQAFGKGYELLIAGSTWPADEVHLLPMLNRALPESWKVIIAPHQITENHLQRLQKQLQLPSVRYSAATQENVRQARAMIIDNVGMLAALYRYGRLAFIGGGFTDGIHNILEPIAFGLPVIFGPKFRKFEEGVQLVEHGGAFTIKNTEELIAVFRRLEGDDAYRKASHQARAYIDNNSGATAAIITYIDEHHKLSAPGQTHQ